MYISIEFSTYRKHWMQMSIHSAMMRDAVRDTLTCISITVVFMTVAFQMQIARWLCISVFFFASSFCCCSLIHVYISAVVVVGCFISLPIR